MMDMLRKSLLLFCMYTCLWGQATAYYAEDESSSDADANALLNFLQYYISGSSAPQSMDTAGKSLSYAQQAQQSSMGYGSYMQQQQPQSTGYGTQQQSTGYGFQQQQQPQQQSGYGMQSYGNQQTQSGYGMSQNTGYGMSQNSGYGGSMQNSGYGGMSQNSGYGGMSQNSGYGGMMQNSGYGMQQQSKGYGKKRKQKKQKVFVPIVIRKKKQKKRKIVAVYKGFYIQGGTQVFGKFKKLSDCKKACEITPTCFAADYNPSLKKCYFHSNITACANMRTHPKLVHFKKVPCDLLESPRGLITLGVQIFGGLEQRGIKNLQDCIKKCATAGRGIADTNTNIAMQTCFGIDYDFGTHKCYFHTDPLLCPAVDPIPTPSRIVGASSTINILLCPLQNV